MGVTIAPAATPGLVLCSYTSCVPTYVLCIFEMVSYCRSLSGVPGGCRRSNGMYLVECEPEICKAEKCATMSGDWDSLLPF